MKKLVSVIILSAMLMLCFVSCEEQHLAPSLSDIDLTATSSMDNIKETDKETDYVIIDVKDYGKIVIRLFPNVAPKTVANFKKLIEQKFYDGIIFHRVIEDFMIQGGGFTPDLKEKDADEIKGEFNANGFENNLLHFRGVVSMARLDNDNDSASSQFFIMHKTTASLNGQYASFGYVVYGMDVVDDIAEVSTTTEGQHEDVPREDIVINSIRFADISGTVFDIQ